MLNSAHRKWLIVVATCAFAVTACGKKEPPSPLTDTSGLLRYVPADSPYVLGALAPAPDEFIEKMEPKVDEILISYRAMLRAIVEEAAKHEGDEDAPDAETMAMIEGVLGEMTSLLSMEDLRGAGITSESTAVIYGVGLLPVLRLTLTDSALLDDAISRIEEKAGQSLPVGQVAGKNYRYFDAEEVRIIIGTFDNQFILTVIPASFEAAQLEEALGLRLPAKNIAETSLLQEIADEYGYLPEYIGFVSTERVADTFLDEPTGLNADLLALFDYDASGLSDVCKAEIRSLAAVMPRIVTGYSEISTDRIVSGAVFEMREDIAEGLATIPTAVPGLGQVFDALFSLGMSMDLKAARGFYEQRVEALENDPFECEVLGGLQAGAVAGREALNQPIPPVVYDFRGFLAVVTELEGFDMKQMKPPESVEASLLVAMDNAPSLLALGQMTSPELAEMDIQPDGEPRQLELPAAQGMGVDNAWLALTDSLLAVSVGKDAEKALPALIESDSASPPPFLSLGIDAGQYYALMAQAAQINDGDKMSAEMSEAIAGVLAAAGDIYDTMQMNVSFTSRGIEIDADLKLAD